MSKASRRRWKESQVMRSKNLSVVQGGKQESETPSKPPESGVVTKQVKMPRRFHLETISIDLIDVVEVQPEHRTDDARVKELLGMIREYGLIVPPIVVPKESGPRYVSEDGNRRIRCAREEGYTHLQCLVLEDVTKEDRAALFFLFNCFTRPVHGNERVEAYGKTDPRFRESVLANMKPAQRKQIEALEELLGFEEIVRLSAEGVPISSLPRCVDRVQEWFEAYAMKPRPSRKTIAYWILDNKALRLIDTVARNYSEKPVTAIHRHIVNNLPWKNKRV